VTLILSSYPGMKEAAEAILLRSFQDSQSPANAIGSRSLRAIAKLSNSRALLTSLIASGVSGLGMAGRFYIKNDLHLSGHDSD
jgi:hypothetical protein